MNEVALNSEKEDDDDDEDEDEDDVGVLRRAAREDGEERERTKRK